MRKILITLLIIINMNISLYALGDWDRINLAITPIRNDVTVEKGDNTVWSVTLYNNSDIPYSFYMSAENCTTTNYQSPICTAIPANSGVNPNSLASWITFDMTGLFSIGPKSSKVVTYTIHTPANAIPGGHYGAIFFNNPENTSNSTSISMNRRIGSLLLVTVPWVITVAPEFGNIEVKNQSGWGGYSSWSTIITDLFSINNTGSISEQITEKWKKLLMLFSDPKMQEDIIDFFDPLWSAPEIDPNITFNMSIWLPVKNTGTIHIVPEGKITLHDNEGNQLKNIWKEFILNPNGAIIGEKIVDYLTINEENGNVLPWTNRTFIMNWYGFARETIGTGGKIEVIYETPGAYYSRITREQAWYLNPWEKLTIQHTVKEINAHIDLSYMNPVTHQTMNSNSIIPITIEYDEVVKTLNAGTITVTSFLILLFWFIFRRRKKNNKKINKKHVIESTQSEIEALEQARAILFAKEAARAAREEATKTARKNKKIESVESQIAAKKTPKKPTTSKE